VNFLEGWKSLLMFLPLISSSLFGIWSHDSSTVIYVHPDESLQAAINRASPGTTIIVEAGEFRESLVIHQPGLRLIGMGASQRGTILSNEGLDADTGITVTAEADDFQLTGFLIRGFHQNGVQLTEVRHYTVTHNRFEHNGEYGIFPLACTDGLIADNIAIGHTDSGLYVGQSSHTRVVHNFVQENFKGIEVENSIDCTVAGNEAARNRVGILVIALDLTPIVNTERVVVTGNLVHENPPMSDSPEGAIPWGGILVIGADHVTVSDNLVLANHPYGIAVMRLPESLDRFDPERDHRPDHNRIIGNIALDNGTADPDIGGANLFWDNTGEENCWKDNLFIDERGGGSIPPPEALPVCPES